MSRASRVAVSRLRLPAQSRVTGSTAAVRGSTASEYLASRVPVRVGPAPVSASAAPYTSNPRSLLARVFSGLRQAAGSVKRISLAGRWSGVGQQVTASVPRQAHVSRARLENSPGVLEALRQRIPVSRYH